MITKVININKLRNGEIQYLTDILPEIPTNTILYKKLTGIGATYGEIKTKRNSIIIEPNVPVIKGKCKDPKHKDDNLFGVFEGIFENDVIKYLKNSDKKKRMYKLLCTPESFTKIKNAFDDLDIDIYSSCFLLFDECHKIIKDADYRSDITLPFDDFFMFDNKALVSATPISFSDPRFEKNKFGITEVCPSNFEYKKQVKVYSTNNIIQLLSELILNKEPEKHFFFFINSTDLILALIQNLKIENSSTVFCASKSVIKLKDNKFKNAYSDWNIEKIGKYNFMTSRFFNALDITLDEKPDVFIITDVYISKFSMVDPFTDSIQILGRFRNGVNSFSHITNTNYNLPIRNKEEVKITLKVFEGVYNIFKKFFSSTKHSVLKESINEIIKVMPFTSMLDKYGNINYFTIDNYIDEAIKCGYYKNKYQIVKAYNDTKMFFAKDYNNQYPIDGRLSLELKKKSLSIKEKRKIIISQLEELKNDNTEMSIEYKRVLENTDNFIFKAFNLLGKDIIEKLDFSYKKINEAIILKQYKEQIKGTETIKLIKNSFKVNNKYTVYYIKKELKRIYNLLNIVPDKAITAKTINIYFITQNTSIKKERAYYIVSEKL